MMRLRKNVALRLSGDVSIIGQTAGGEHLPVKALLEEVNLGRDGLPVRDEAGCLLTQPGLQVHGSPGVRRRDTLVVGALCNCLVTMAGSQHL